MLPAGDPGPQSPISHVPNRARIRPSTTWPAKFAIRKRLKPMPMEPAEMEANVVKGFGNAESEKMVGTP